MCGPATVPITFACTPKWPSASTRLVAVRSWPAVSGRVCSPRRARQQPARVGQLPDEVGVVGDGAAQPALRRELRGVGARDARDLLLLGLLARLAASRARRGGGSGRGVRPARARRPAGRSASSSSCGSGASSRQSREGASTCVARTISSAGSGLGRVQLLLGAEVAQQLAARVRAGAASRRPAARAESPDHARRVEQPVPGRAQRRRERGARQQDHADEQQEHDEDADAERPARAGRASL